MSKFLYLIFIPLFALTLSGCTTDEVRKTTEIDDNLTFYPESAKNKTQEQKPASNETKTSDASQPTNSSKKPMYNAAPTMRIDANKMYTATLKTTAGNIVIELNAKNTPITVNNFVFLAREKFYDNTIFHRTIKDFMIQGGDPTGTGTGGPGYRFDDEPFDGEYMRGTVAMANAGPDTNGSQFFIMHKDVPLPKNYVIFGKVTEGMDVVDKIATAPTKPEGEGSTPVNPVTIQSVDITEK